MVGIGPKFHSYNPNFRQKFLEHDNNEHKRGFTKTDSPRIYFAYLLPTFSFLSSLIDVKMPKSKLSVAILIVSDTSAQDPRTDKCAPILRERFTTANWEIAVTHIIYDNKDDIQVFVKKWTDGHNWANCIVTSGGTGFAIRDQTPEVGMRY
jgi:hypothetical protein